MFIQSDVPVGETIIHLDSVVKCKVKKFIPNMCMVHREEGKVPDALPGAFSKAIHFLVSWTGKAGFYAHVGTAFNKFI